MTDLNISFCRAILAYTMQTVSKVTTPTERKSAWVYKTSFRDTYEFHGPAGFYWAGRASNAYDAREKGWSSWLAHNHPAPSGEDLETLYLSCGDSDEANAAYSVSRAAKVAEIAEHIRDDLNSPETAEAIAEQMMQSAEEFGRIDGNTVSAEVASRYTITGNPIPTLI